MWGWAVIVSPIANTVVGREFMLKIESNKNLLPFRMFGGLFLLVGMVALALEEPYSSDRILSVFLVSYFFWGLSFSATTNAESITKKRGWLFPYFKSDCRQLKRIELRTLYIYQHEYGAQSRYIFYVGIISGVSNEFVNLSWGDELKFLRFFESPSGMSYRGLSAKGIRALGCCRG